jgi:hypothetical protein
MSNKKVVSELTVNTDTYTGSKYSQAASVTVTNFDITIEFVYIDPRDKKGQVISRITLPRPVGEGLAKTIMDTVRMHVNKKND